MKLFKSISIIIFILISWNIKATNVETDSTKKNDENTKLKISNVNPDDDAEEDEYVPLTRDVLLNLSKSGEYNTEYHPLKRNVELYNKINVYVSYKVDKFNYDQNYKLICLSDSGVFVYGNSFIEYIPYKNIEFIQRYRSFKKQLKITTLWGLGFGLALSIGIADPIPLVTVPAVVDAYFIGIVGPLYFIGKYLKNYRYPIKYIPRNGLEFNSLALSKPEIFGKDIELINYPTSNMAVPLTTESEELPVIIAKEKPKQIDTITNNSTIPNKITNSNPIVTKIEFPKLNTPSGKINPQWMYLSFNKLEVNEKKLLAKFKNIQGTQLIAENLQNLNPSEIQYLAITIATLNGYNFRNIVSFTESQNLNLKNYESYISSEVKGDSEIDPSNLQELDLNNINLIYSVLKEKTN